MTSCTFLLWAVIFVPSLLVLESPLLPWEDGPAGQLFSPCLAGMVLQAGTALHQCFRIGVRAFFFFFF